MIFHCFGSLKQKIKEFEEKERFMRKPFECCLSWGDGAILECSESELLPGLWFSLVLAFGIVEQKAIFSGTELTPSYSCTMRSMKLIAAKSGINC
ncbi:hypothetical protein QQP08_023852 [Theobroma cacao]|nr:hypothetical protein QQP08_023852 [Theobroma cacao]